MPIPLTVRGVTLPFLSTVGDCGKTLSFEQRIGAAVIASNIRRGQQYRAQQSSLL